MIFFNPACKVVYLWIVLKSCNQYLGLEVRNTLRIAEIKVLPATKKCFQSRKWLWPLRPFAALHYASRALACLERGKHCIRACNRRLMETKYSMALPAPLPIWGILGPYCRPPSPGGTLCQCSRLPSAGEKHTFVRCIYTCHGVNKLTLVSDSIWTH